jgi:hypothetical protein
MQPFIPRRRNRRRSISGRMVLLGCAVVLTALVVGGVTQISRQSGPYDATLNRSFAAQGAVVATESNSSATELRQLMSTMRNLPRQVVQEELDSEVQQTASEESLAQAAPASPPQAAQQAAFVAVFAARAKAVRQIRSSIDDLLGMRPLPVAGGPDGNALLRTNTTLASSTASTNGLVAAGALLTTADQRYQSVRRELRAASGHADLPRSKWVTSATAWQADSLTSVVNGLSISPELGATHRLLLSSVRINPPDLPTVSGASSQTSTLSPTTSVTVTAVLSDLGSVDEPDFSVQYMLTPELNGTAVTPVTKVKRSSLEAGGSVVMAPVRFKVKPGHRYQLIVAIELPATQSVVTQTSQTDDLEIAPST